MKNKNDIVSRRIANIYEKILEIRSSELTKLGIRSNDYSYFLDIFEAPGCTQNHLANKRNIDKAVVARTIIRYVEQGYIKRTQNPHNKSASSLYLTESGIVIEELIESIISDINQSIKSYYSSEEFENLIYHLDKLSNILEGGSDEEDCNT